MATRKKVDTTAGSPHIGEDLPGVPQGGGGVAAEPHIGEGLLAAQGDDVARDAALPAAPAGEPVEDTRMPGDAPAMPGEAGGAMPPGGMGGGDDDAARAQDEDLPTSRTCVTMDLHHQLLIEDPVYVRLRAEIEDRFQRWTHGHHVVGVAQGR